mgnify:CR=1 FL=1
MVNNLIKLTNIVKHGVSHLKNQIFLIPYCNPNPFSLKKTAEGISGVLCQRKRAATAESATNQAWRVRALRNLRYFEYDELTPLYERAERPSVAAVPHRVLADVLDCSR